MTKEVQQKLITAQSKGEELGLATMKLIRALCRWIGVSSVLVIQCFGYRRSDCFYYRAGSRFSTNCRTGGQMSKQVLFRPVVVFQAVIWACFLLVVIVAPLCADPVPIYVAPVGATEGTTMNITGEYMEKISIPGVYYAYLDKGKIYVQSKYGEYAFIESNVIWYLVVPKGEK